ncbi:MULTISPECIES: MFS transporter [Gammaproteobacteria]|uniref:MFS transporter n=1 Tax=Gammaproteobacteria TaxID=1236 RepID=UPI000DCF79C6|nr:MULTISPECIES: MFS transporter [Gammaproteobacteria]RTE85826.1 MFS transporter [Aliidiomarina sp. B3213]TCZ90173.1 MFS transporter [Lysobacter sp. N42]
MEVAIKNRTWFKSLPAANEHGITARVLLAFLATAGLFYVNIMPAIVSGLIDGLAFTRRDAGLVGSLNIYGAAVGAFLAIFLVKRVPWKPVSAGLLISLITIDFLSMLVELPLIMMALRALHGFVGGLLVGVAFAVIARTQYVHKTFGMLLLVQFGLGGLGVMFLPPLVPVFGAWILFLSLIAFSTAALIMLPFLSDYPVAIVDKTKPVAPILWKPLSYSIFAVFLFQAANMALYAYIIDLGEQAGLTKTAMSPALGVSAWLGILGSVMVMWLSTRVGRSLPILIGVLVTAGATFALHFSFSLTVYWIANILVGITWAFSIAYLLGVCSEFDKAGQTAALAGFASKMGLASGPLFAALIVTEGSYTMLINIATAMLIAAAFITLYPSKLLDNSPAT